MAKNKIEIDVNVDDKGTTKKVALGAKQAADGLDKTAKSASTADRNLKGASQQSANGTKNFSKMAQGIGGKLVPAYATLAANIFAVTAAFNAFQKAAQLQQLESNLIRFGNVAGQNYKSLANDLREITGNAIDAETALRTVAQGTTQGFSSTQLTDLTKIAKGASIALGRDMTDAMDRLVRGTAKLEPEILDELGIIVRLDDAARDYASALGKTANQLTAFEKQQAFANAVTEQGLKKFGDIAKLSQTNPYDRLSASFSNLTKTIFEGLNTVITPLITFLSENPTALSGAVAVFASTIVKQLTPALSELATESKEKFAALSKNAKEAAKQVQTKYQAMAKNLPKTDFSPPGFKEVEESIRRGTASLQDFNKGIKSLEASERKRMSTIKALEAETSSLNAADKARHIERITEKEAELAIIQEQLAVTRQLKEIEKSGTKRAIVGGTGSAQQTAQVLAAQSSIAGIEATAFAAMQGQGIVEQFKAATAGAKEMFAQLKPIPGVFAKIRVGALAATASIRLFGFAILNAIPLIGQIVLVGTVLWQGLTALFGNPFDPTPSEKALEDVKKKLEGVTEASVDMRVAILNAASETEKAFIRIKGSGGIIDQLAASFTDLVSSAEKARAEKIKEAAEAYKEALQAQIAAERNATGSNLSITRLIGAEAALSNTAKALDNLVKKELEFAATDTLSVAMAGRAQAIIAGFDKSGSVIQKYDEIIAKVQKRLEDGATFSAEELRDMNKEISETGVASKKFTSAFGEMGQAVSNFRTELNKLGEKQNSPVSSLLDSSQALLNIFTAIEENLPSALKESGGTINIREAVEGQGGKISTDYLNQLKQSKAYVEYINNFNPAALLVDFGDIPAETQIGALVAAQEANTGLIGEANKLYLQSSATTNKLKTNIKEIAGFSKQSTVFLNEQIGLEKDLLGEKINLNNKIIEILEGNAAFEEIVTKLKKENKSLSAEQGRLDNDTLRLAQTKYEQEKQRLDIANKLTQAQQEQLRIAESLQQIREKAELRQAKATPFFDFTDQGRLELEQKIAQAQRQLLQEQSDGQTAIDNAKMAIIKAEYALLSAQITAAAESARARGNAPDRDGDGVTTPAETAAAANATKEAERLEGLLPTINNAEKIAVENVGTAKEARIAAIKETIAELTQAKDELSDSNRIMNTLESSLTSGLTNAIDGLIQGTMSVKEAFASMATSILQSLSKVIAELIAIQILKSIISGFTGPSIGDISGTGAASSQDIIAGNFRYGGISKAPEMALGGVLKGPSAGYPVTMHGTEAVVPLPNGKSIPVEMKGAGQNNNVVVNVSMDGGGNTQQNSQSSGQQGSDLGKAIAAAVQKELQDQKRSGGILNPYGVA